MMVDLFIGILGTVLMVFSTLFAVVIVAGIANVVYYFRQGGA